MIDSYGSLDFIDLTDIFECMSYPAMWTEEIILNYGRERQFLK
jgi:hypothetical protein